MNGRLAQPGWWQALCAAGIALAVDALYLAIIQSEGEGELTSARVLFVAGCVAGAAVVLVWGVAGEARRRATLFAGGAALLVVWTFLGALSIGILLAPAAVLAVLAASRAAPGSRRYAAFAAIAAVALVVLGLFLT